MDAVFARREAEAGTESHDLLLQQEEAEEREQDVRDAEGPQGRRQQAHGLALPTEGVTRFPPPPRGTARRSPFSLSSLPLVIERDSSRVGITLKRRVRISF